MQFKDPMASFMDLCSSMRPGEQFWFQMIVVPTDFSWVKKSEKEINKILGRKEKVKEGLFIKSLTALGNASESIYPIWGDIDPSKKKDEKSKTMMDLSPGEKEKVEAIQLKASKLGFEAKIRVIYMAKKEVMNRAKAVSGFVGYIKQFVSLNLNNLKPELKKTATRTAYFLKNSRLISKKRKIFSAYINRSDWMGATPGLFNIEELATLWHFPVEPVARSGMLQKAPGRKADAPAYLPVDDEVVNNSGEFLNFISDKQETDNSFIESDLNEEENLKSEDFFNDSDDSQQSEPPTNLPIA